MLILSRIRFGTTHSCTIINLVLVWIILFTHTHRHTKYKNILLKIRARRCLEAGPRCYTVAPGQRSLSSVLPGRDLGITDRDFVSVGLVYGQFRDRVSVG